MNTGPNFMRVDTAKFYGPFRDRLMDIIDRLNTSGTTYIATLGFRTFPEQAALYFQGRTTQGPIVTNAPPGLSAHNYGLACDFVRMFDGKTPSWDPQDYDALGEEAERESLVWGGRWMRPDRPHVQWPGYVTAGELQPLKSLYLIASGDPIEAVWEKVMHESPTLKSRLPEGIV